MNARTAYDKARSVDLDEPILFSRAIPPGEAYPLESLGHLRHAAEALADMTQAPAAICAQAVLGVAALAAQALGDAETLHGRAPASLYLLTVAQSGERKTAVDRLAMQAVTAFEAELRDLRWEAMTSYQNRLDIWEARRADIVKGAKTDSDSAQADLQALGPRPEEPLYAVITSPAPTVEGITKHLGLMRPGLGIFSDEGGAFVGGYAMAAENKLATVSALSDFWDGEPVKRLRAGDGVQLFPGRRLSFHLMMQPVAAARLLADPVANQQGFIARFLVTEPPSAIGTRTRVGHDPASDEALAGFTARIGSMLRRDLPLKTGTRNELEPPLVALSAEARALLQTFAIDVEKAQLCGRDLEAVRPFASKAAEHAARLAAVMAIYADAETVSGETMADGIALARFYLGEAARLADTAVLSAETTEAEMLLRWLLDSWSDPFISATDVANSGPNKLRETKKARRVLTSLEEHGWVVPVEGEAMVKGKKRRAAWRVVRRAGL